MKYHLIELAKRIPVDFGQGTHRRTTKGKLIAQSLIPRIDNGMALDVGCREGYQSKFLENLGYQVVSIDIDKVYAKCILADANRNLPFREMTFDLVWCSEVIEHLRNPEAFIRDVDRVLKPGGHLILTTPNSFFWLYSVTKLFGLTPARLQNPGHIHFFNLADMRSLFPQDDVYGFFPYFLFKFTIRKAIGPLSPTFVVHHVR